MGGGYGRGHHGVVPHDIIHDRVNIACSIFSYRYRLLLVILGRLGNRLLIITMARVRVKVMEMAMIIFLNNFGRGPS